MTLTLRLCLYTPLKLAGGLCGVIAGAFERVQEVCDDLATDMKQICKLPYAREWQRQLDAMTADRRERALRGLIQENP